MDQQLINQIAAAQTALAAGEAKSRQYSEEMQALEADAAALEQSARDKRQARFSLKQQKESQDRENAALRRTLDALGDRQIQQAAAESAKQAAAAAQANEAKAAEVLAEIERMKAELAEQLAKAKVDPVAQVRRNN